MNVEPCLMVRIEIAAIQLNIIVNVNNLRNCGIITCKKTKYNIVESNE